MHEAECRLALDTYKKGDSEEEKQTEMAASMSAKTTPDVATDDSDVDIKNSEPLTLVR